MLIVMNYNRLLACLGLFCLAGWLLACREDGTADVPQPKTVTVSSLDPATAPVGSTIAVNGTNFSTDPTSTTITIGGVPATIVSASATRLVVTVPDGAANGPVAVSTGGQTVQSPTLFTVAPRPLKPVVEVQGTRFANQTWDKDTIYLLRGMVYIPADYTLTIEPGTVIKGAGPDRDPAGRNMAGTLIVERRGRIIARGTAQQPIVFTSAKPAGQRNYGDWGGVVLVGKSPVNRPGLTSYPGGVRGPVETYSEPFDNTGIFEYVRIEFAGTPLPATPDNRLSGLTFLGVGSNTVVNHVQVSYSSGDAFGWFGGTVNAKHLVAFRAAGDDWSTDWGHTGNVQFGVALRDPDVSDPAGVYGFLSQNFDPGENADGSPLSKGNGSPQTAPVFANMSNFAFGGAPTGAAYRAGMLLRRNTAISVYNSLIYGYPEGVRLEGTATGAGLGNGALDLKGIVLANVQTPVVGGDGMPTEQATGYFAAAGRNNQIIASADVASLLLNGANFSLTAPNFLPQSGSPLLSGAVSGGKLADPFFTPVSFRGAFGTTNWTAGWTNFTPQTADYDR